MNADSRIAMTVTFRRWRKRHPWTCRRCGAQVVEARTHAGWHAALEANADRWPPDCSQSEGRQPEELTLHITENGRTL